jgi:hypothetical protein
VDGAVRCDVGETFSVDDVSARLARWWSVSGPEKLDYFGVLDLSHDVFTPRLWSEFERRSTI